MTTIRYSTSQTYTTSASLMSKLSAQTTDLQTQIATGVKYSAPSDNAAAYAQLATISRANSADDAYSSNISLAEGLLTESDSTLSSVSTELDRAKEIALSASNGTLSDDDLASAATELDGIIDDLLSLANTTNSQGYPLFGGSTGDTAYVQNDDGTISYAGSGTPSAIPIGANSSVQASDTGDTIFGGISTADGGTTDIFAVLQSLSSALKSGGDVSDATATAIDGIDAASAQVTDARASVGARQARLELSADQITSTGEAREERRSALEDTDVTTAVTQLQQAMTVLEATQASFTKLSSLSLFNYLN